MSSISLNAHLEYDKVARDKSHVVHLLVELEGKKVDLSSRKPLAISVAIDCSGSMSGDAGMKMEYAKKSLLKLIEHLSSADTLGVVGFSDSVWTVFGPAKMTAEAKENARIEVEKLHPIACTNLSGAAISSLDMLRSADADVLRAMLFTDGIPTAGECSHSRLVEIAGGKPEKAGLTCFGYGSDHNPELLSSMAKAGGGNFYFVKSPDEVPPMFGRELGGLLSCVGQNIKVKIKAGGEVKILEVLNDLDVDANDKQTEAVVSLDDIYSEEKRRVLLKVELPETSKAVSLRPSKVADIEVSYFDLGMKENGVLSTSVSVEYVKPEDAQKKANEKVAEQIAAHEAAKAQEQAIELVMKGDYSGARGLVMACAVRCRDLGTEFSTSMADDLENNVGNALMDEESCGLAGGMNYLVTNKAAYGRGRGMTAGTAFYTTQAQQDMAKAFSDPSQSAGLVSPPPKLPEAKKEKLAVLSKRRKKR